LVVIGTGQRHGMDYEETFAPVPHSESVKVVLSGPKYGSDAV